MENLKHRKTGAIEKQGASEDKHETLALAGTGNKWSPAKPIVIILMIVFNIFLFIEFFIESPIDPISFRLALSPCGWDGSLCHYGCHTSLPDPPKFTGPLQPNSALTKAVTLFTNDLRGPESIAIQNGHIYTGTADGRIVHIHDGQMETVVSSIGTPPCGSFGDEPTCGRPLGLRFDTEGSLLVVDAYLGLHRVNVTSGSVEKLFAANIPIGGVVSRLLNDITISSDGTIYLTDSSTTWDRRSNRLFFAENKPDGRLIKYDPRTNTTSVLAYGIAFANGVQLSADESHILITESARARVLRYHLVGEKAGTVDTFIDNLPGLPDNIRPSSSGGYWMGVASVRQHGRLNAYDKFATQPWLRKFLLKVMDPETYIGLLGVPYGLVLEVDTSGRIVRSLHDPTGDSVLAVSEVEEYQGALYLGSYGGQGMKKIQL